MRKKDTFLEKVFKYIIPSMSVLDVGAGSLKSSMIFLARGYDITALDIHTLAHIPNGVNFIQADFINWEPDKKYDVLFMRNSAQFMPKEEFMAKINKMRPQVIAIRTFYAPPVPDFEGTYSMTYYDLADFSFPGYSVATLDKREEDGVDMRGIPRRFRLIEYIGVRE